MTMQHRPNRLRKSFALIALVAMAGTGAPAMADPGACVIAKVSASQAFKLYQAAKGICSSVADVDACVAPSRNAYEMAAALQQQACPDSQ